ncbi:MAG: TetR/AcrR family transcriptional regulator [Gammaproteobacteria bacterium]|nr:TetR/AcrR family transcriptional regulator [Gammaproteobacteria bacterium]
MTDITAAPTAKTVYVMRKQPRQRRARATVDAILEAAARILVASGYASASTNRIAGRAGVGIGSLYEYFPGKEAIFAELRRREMARWYAKLRAGPVSGPPRDVIAHIVHTRIAFTSANPALYAALETEVPRAAVAEMQGTIQDDFLSLSTAYLAAHRDLLRPKAPMSFVSEFLARWVNSTIHDFAMHAPAALAGEHLADELIDAVARYLLSTDEE